MISTRELLHLCIGHPHDHQAHIVLLGIVRFRIMSLDRERGQRLLSQAGFAEKYGHALFLNKLRDNIYKQGSHVPYMPLSGPPPLSRELLDEASTVLSCARELSGS